MTEHTPGPWKLEPRHPKGLFVSGGDEIHSVVCQIRDYPNEGRRESDANARLIAAAPAMLAALRGLMSELDDPDKPAFWPISAEINAAAAAIAKAEGR